MLEFITQNELLTEFSQQQLIATLLIFCWTGFVRSGLGFGGSALGLPLMLMVDDSPLFWLPIIGLHLLFFTSLTLLPRLKNIDWGYTKSSLKYILPAKFIGVFGLLNLPNEWLVILIYSITFCYSILWISNLNIKSQSGWSDKLLLTIGGYVSGTSLTGAPLIVAVFMQHVNKFQLRDTLFALWFLLVAIKMSTFVLFSVDLHLLSSILLIPVAWIGHLIGLKMHQHIVHRDLLFKRVTGGILLAICLLGFANIFNLF
ncbi:MAG: TSUP family transporter [Gammaproteobacteria bacterium]|nr:TSUP family transporter [Gammaproteobacteria bacterium]